MTATRLTLTSHLTPDADPPGRRAARTCLYALVAVLPLLPEAQAPHAQICTVVLPAVLLAAVCGKRPAAAGLRPLCRLLPFVVLSGCSLLVSPCRQAGWPAFGLLLAHLGGAAAAALCINKKEQVARLLQFATASGALVAGIGIAQYYGWRLPGWAVSFPGRITATFANPNHLGSYLACLLPPASILIAAAWRPLASAFWSLAAVCIYTALFLSASRGGWWAAVLALAGLGLALWRAGLRPRHARLALKAAFGACCAATLLYSTPSPLRMPRTDSLPQRFSETGDLIRPQVVGQTSLGHRRLIWKTTLDIAWAHPLIGVGYGTYDRMYPVYRDQRLAYDPAFQRLAPAMRAENARHAHNEYLQICAESGIPALLMFLFGLGPVFIHPAHPAPDALHRLGLWGVLVALLVNSLVSYPLRLPLLGLVFWVSVGLCLTSPAPRGRSHGSPPCPAHW